MMKLQGLDSNDLAILTEALHRLRQVKVEAHAELVKVPGHEGFTQTDFGVPKIDALLAKVDAAYEKDEAQATDETEGLST